MCGAIVEAAEHEPNFSGQIAEEWTFVVAGG
jgi:hypothetical protein